MEPKYMYEIALYGCDDATIFYMELTQTEYELLKKVSEKSKETSTYGCMPTMEIELNDIPTMKPESRA